ncbi:MAG TPA: hypothetical protein VE619_03885 [Nitrososphaeraceae archaeon]|nr:hypothetical protein [Nitrososphaeraceae archaeon]
MAVATTLFWFDLVNFSVAGIFLVIPNNCLRKFFILYHHFPSLFCFQIFQLVINKVVHDDDAKKSTPHHTPKFLL